MSVKLAISLEEPLLERIDSAAKHLEIPRSRLIAQAADEYVARLESQLVTEQLNRVYADPPTPEEVEYQQQMREYHRRMHKEPW
jgi:metal-responsive CopG/Arc/MetJ family transcriptional regulator